MVNIRVLGELELEADGQVLERIRSQRARSLISWLAVHSGLHPRSRVASVFWPDVLDESARSSLRTTLATLRRELGPTGADVVTATRDRVGIELGPEVSIDLSAFEELVSRGELEEAATLCHGELLADLDDDWVYEARESHRRQVLDLLGRLADEAESSGDLDAALDRNREQVGLDPLSEEAQGNLIRRLAKAGDRAGALAAYKTYGARLRRDVGIAPSAAIREMAEAIRSGSSQPAGNGAGSGVRQRTPPEVHYGRCADCGHENAPDRRFCGSCGHALFQVCPSCGEESPSRVDFCGACGSPLVPSAPVAAALEGERRWATVLFGDLAGFTQLSETTDPEDVRLMIDRCTSRDGGDRRPVRGLDRQGHGRRPDGGLRGADRARGRRGARGPCRARASALRG